MTTDITYLSYFYSTLCHVCKSNDPEKRRQLKRCSGCRMIAYCGQEHQKQHWRKHKKICKIIQSAMREGGSTSMFQEANEFTTIDEWIRLRCKSMMTIEVLLGRKLFPDEREMFQFPRVCEVCRQARQSMLVDCPKCLCVSYCSVDHQESDAERHSLSCELLGLTCYLNSIFTNLISIPYPTIKLSVQETQLELPGNIELFVENYTNNDKAEESVFCKIFSTEILSWSLTLLYTIIKCNITQNSDVVVHIIGASPIECSVVDTFQTILHWLPKLKKLRLVLIGPDVQDLSEDITMCDACLSHNKLLAVDYYTGFYHNYFQSTSFVKPNVIVAYNCGFQEYEGSDNDTWLPSFPLLLYYEGVHLILTSYTAVEAKKDLKSFIEGSKCEVQVLLDSKLNPFHGRRPCRDWEHDGAGVFYINSYISVLRLECKLCNTSTN